jgi:hypothetical protein
VVVRETTFSGSYLNSRRIGDVVHTVVVFPEVSVPGVSYFPQELKDVYGWCGGGDTKFTDDEIVAMFALLEEKNVQTIANATISQFLPGIKDIRWYGSEKTVEEGLLQDCKDFYLAKAADGSSFLSLASLDIDDQGPIGVTTIVGKPGAVYASFDALYIAQRHYPENLGGAWFYDESEGIKEATTVHKFALTGGIGSEYRGSGAVKGRILNQFAMDEKDGVLRIATSMGHVPDPNCYSTVATLAESQGELVVLGMADHIAPTEDIRSVRFDGDLGFVVTFKKTDPLFVIDLSVPDNPVVKGELKIPGFSTYMHMLDATHILSIGYDADDQGSFAWFQGIRLQVMDVTDVNNPTLLFAEVIGSRGSTSDAATNHLAFTFFRDRNLLGLPMTICEGGSGGSYGNQMTFSGLLVYRVTVDKGFEKMGGIPHVAPQDFADYQACGNWWTNSNSLVKRSVFMDDWVYSIALDQIKTANLLDLANPVASVSLDVP